MVWKVLSLAGCEPASGACRLKQKVPLTKQSTKTACTYCPTHRQCVSAYLSSSAPNPQIYLTCTAMGEPYGW